MLLFNGTYANPARADGKFPIVCRLEPTKPSDIRGIVQHAERVIGDLSHIDFFRTHMNEIFIEPVGGIEAFLKTLESTFRTFNYRSRLLGARDRSQGGAAKSGGKRRRVSKEVARVKLEGPSDPWRYLRKSRGPLREGVLTVHRDWFRAEPDTQEAEVLAFLDDQGEPTRHDRRKYRLFREVGEKLLCELFGDALVYARMDCDEQAGHIQFVLCDSVTIPVSERYAHGRKLLSLEKHELIRGRQIEITFTEDGDGDGDGTTNAKPRYRTILGYELIQDACGEFFARPEFQHMNIVRGKASSRARREAKETLDALQAEIQETDLPWEDPLPNGSLHARTMKVVKDKIAAEAEKTGGLDKIQSMRRLQLAVETLHTFGVITDEQRHQNQTRRSMSLLVEAHEATFGTADEIISRPDEVAKKAGANIKAQRKALDDYRNNLEADRLRLYCGLQEMKKKSKELKERETAAARRETALRKRVAVLFKQSVENSKRLKEREANVKQIEDDLQKRDHDLVRREKGVVEILRTFFDQQDTVKALLPKLRDTMDPVVKKLHDAFKSKEQLQLEAFIDDANRNRGYQRVRGRGD